jgi:hypothetical protein
MPVSKISFNLQNGVQKGPGCDTSMITNMKRQAVLVAEAKITPNGKKNTGPIVDTQHTRGMDGGVFPLLINPAGVLGFLKTY